MSSRRVLWVTGVLFSCAFVLFYAFFIAILQVTSGSMRDTLKERDYIVILRTDFLVRARLITDPSIRRGQIVVLHSPYDPSIILVKRVVALGGEKVRILKGTVIINGVAQAESYIHTDLAQLPNASWPSGWVSQGQRDITVPLDHYFVLGDNRNSSTDSRDWGAVRVQDVVGKLLFTIKH